MMEAVLSHVIGQFLPRLYCYRKASPEELHDLIAGANSDLLFMRRAIKELAQIVDKEDANDNFLRLTRDIIRHFHICEDDVESCILEAKSRWNGFMNIIFKISTQKKITEKTRGQINFMQNSFMIVQSQWAISASVRTNEGLEYDEIFVPTPDPADIVRMEDDTEKDLVSALTQGTKHLNLVFVCGMPGIGKTTLAREIYNDPEIESRFLIRAWVSVSQKCEMKDILQRIHSNMGLSPVSETRDMPQHDFHLQADIYRYLNKKKYLIVLEDMWEADTWFKLRRVFPDDENGSRMLITSRRKDVATQVGGEASYIHIMRPISLIHMMRPLTDEENWKLLRHKLYTLGEGLIEKFGKEIMSAGGGLPFAIVVLAYSVIRKPSKEWKWHLKKLYTKSNPLLCALNSSYKNLPIHLKMCLLFLGTNFPEDAEIEMDTACQLLIADGLPITEYITNAETAESYLHELDKRGLVQILEEDAPGKRRFKSCRIHKVIGSFCKYKGKQHEIFEAVDLGDETLWNSTIRLAMYLNEYECSYDFLYWDIYRRSLSFFGPGRSREGYIRPRQIPSVGNFDGLRVLYLYAVDLKHGKLPQGMEKLVHLRYLSFRDCYLKELCSSIRNMFFLQTLDLRVRNECQIIIPDVLDYLESLRYLYFPLAYRTCNNKKLHLGRLKELELLDNFNTSLCNVEDLLKFTKLIWLTVTAMGDVSEIEKVLHFVSKNSGRLRSTSLYFRNFDCYTTERLSVLKCAFNSSALASLGVEGYLKELPIRFNRTSSNLTEIVLNGSELVEDPMQILQELPRLRILVLEIEAYNGTNMYCSSPGFPELRYLKLSKLYKLRDWLVENEAMPNLCTLVIENCRNLQMLPEGLRFATKLRKLEIASMTSDALIGRIQKSDETEGEDFYKIRHVQPNVKVNGKPLILKERRQAGPGEDPQTSSTPQVLRTQTRVSRHEITNSTE